MKIYPLQYIIGFLLFLLLIVIIGKTTHNTHIPMVLIVKEDHEKIIKREAYDNVMEIFENEHDDIQFVSKVVDFSENDTNRTKTDLKGFIQKNKDHLVYIVFMPSDTSKYNQIKKYLPESIPIITSIGTVESLEKNNTWVTTTSSLAKGKAEAIKKLMQIEQKDKLIALYDKAEDNDTYTDKVLDELDDLNVSVTNERLGELNVSVTRVSYTKGMKIKLQKKLQEGENKLILLVSKSSGKTLEIFKNFKKYIYDVNNPSDVLLLKIKVDDKKSIYLPKGKVYELTYEIPGYNQDLRLPFYQEGEDICSNITESKKDECIKEYGNAYIKLHTFLNLALGDQDTDFNNTPSSDITKIRKDIHSNIINHNKTNIYFNEKTKTLYEFKEFNKTENSKKFHYNSMIESGITNYYIGRLENNNSVFLHDKQISNGMGEEHGSLNTVYLDMKLSNLIVDNLSASSAYIEGFIRVLTTKKEFDLEKMYRINFMDNDLKKSEITLVKKDCKKDICEKFYIFKGNFNIKNDLMMFPLDKQKIYISFTPRDANVTTDRYLMHLQVQEDNKIIDFDKWKVIKIKPFLSKEIIMFKTSAIEKSSSVSYKPISNFEIIIERNVVWGFLVKFILPIVIILLLVAGTRIHLNQKNDLGTSSGIYGSAFAGIISIYFIFNLVIGIEDFIYFDLIFLFCLGIPVLLLIYNIRKHRRVNWF